MVNDNTNVDINFSAHGAFLEQPSMFKAKMFDSHKNLKVFRNKKTKRS